MKVFCTAAASAAIGLFAGSAMAATVTVSTIYGEWISAGPSTTYDINYDTTDDRTQVWWGKVPDGWTQSGYEFDGTDTPLSMDPDTSVVFGAFTHFNNPIYTYPGDGYTTAITEAQLRIDFEIMVDAVSHSFYQIYTFAHDETPNGGTDGVCAHGGSPSAGINVNGCADRVTATLNEALSEQVVIDGKIYSFDITGFQTGGETLDYFLTKEKANNTALLVGSYSVTPVPLPATGLLLLAGLGGLAALKRRKQATA